MSAQQAERTVVVIEDHALFRQQMVSLINKADGLVVSGEADNAQDGLELIRKTHPKIAVVDISLGTSDGLELVEELRRSGIDLPVVVLSMHEQALYADRAFRAGANAYVNKVLAATELIRAIERVLSGKACRGSRSPLADD